MVGSDDMLEAMFSMESDKSGVVEEPPFRMLVLGDWSGDGERKPLGERRLVEIDRDDFDDVMARLGVALELDYNGEPLRLEFKELDDFHPDRIFQKVPLFEELRDLRRRLKQESTFNSAAREVRSMFGSPESSEPPVAPSAPAEVPAEDLLGAILAKPSGGAAVPKPKPSSDLARLVSDLVRPHLVSVDEGEQAQMTSAVDAATSGLMRCILHDRRFQELEAAWRGLFFLVRRTETSTDLKIFLLDATKGELTEDLKSAEALSGTTLYKHFVQDAVEVPGGEPFALSLGNYAFESGVDDTATLIRLGKIASAANAPFISHMRPDVFGVHSLAEQPDASAWKLADDSTAAKLWLALRDQSEAVYLGMVMPRFLVRLPYGRETEPLDTFNFEEFDATPEHDNYVWANGCFAAGQLLAESFAAYRWDMGRAMKQDIEGLPVHVYKVGTETVYKPCGEVLLNDNAMQKLMDLGFMPLVTYKNSDRVKLARFHSIADTALKGMWS
ncbi:MAG: type VI secretion system contractile sheath large subunit [Acidobacteria bacterium]|nr:type VI secretion system contractile sheath large subunit [Acidobacteriota bacterium]